MEVGYQVGQVVLRDTISLQQQWQEHLEQFRASRDAGFGIYCWAHHYLIDPFQHFQPFPILARLAAEPGNMKLATSVLLLPLLNPVDVAEQVATLDHISEGRFILGLGLGYRPEESEAFNTSMAHRAARSSEALELMVRLWTEEEVTHHGRFFQVTGARPTARPYQQPHPPIWLAAMSDPPIRRVGREGHMLFIGPAQPFETIRRQIDLYHQTLDYHGHNRPEEMVIVREFFCGESRSEALEAARRGFETKYRVYEQHGLQGTDDELTSKITGDLEGLMDDTFIVGSPDECVEQIARYRELGFTHISLRLFYPEMSRKEVLDHIELVGREVLPAVHEL
ncbi:MAG: LLM class flavin-dependent oxidoreductase [Chloroflexota bacterium]|nr:LLM class flavin-dependent oxidoreductase [Chloroflexota bacterium]